MIRVVLIAWILAEIAAFALAGQAFGVLGTLGLVLASALGGGLLLRAQGAQTLTALRSGVRRGGDPLTLLMRDGFRLVAALLLILPGLVGDAVGLLLLVPAVQRRVAADLARRGLGPANLAGRPRGYVAPSGPRAPAARTPRRDVIEAEWEELDPAGPPAASPSEPARRGTPSGWTRP